MAGRSAEWSWWASAPAAWPGWWRALRRFGLELERLADPKRLAVHLVDSLAALVLDPEVLSDGEHLAPHHVAGPVVHGPDLVFPRYRRRDLLRRDLRRGGNHLFAEDFERLDAIDIGHAADRGFDPHAGQPVEALDHLSHLLALIADIEVEHRGLFDVVEISPQGSTVLAEHLELVRDLGGGEEVAGIGVLGHQPKRFLFAHAADEDGRVRSAQRLGYVEGPLELIVLPGVGLLAAVLALPHGQADLQCFLEPLEPFRDWREGNAQPSTLQFVPGGTDPEPGPAAGEDVQGGHRLGEDARIAVDGAGHHGTQLHPLRHRRHEGQRAVALEHLVFRRTEAANLPEVIHDPERIEPGLV